MFVKSELSQVIGFIILLRERLTGYGFIFSKNKCILSIDRNLLSHKYLIAK